jgi:hypothetical protein
MTDLFGALPEATETTADLVTRLEARETPERAVTDLVAARPWPMAYSRVWEPCAGTGVLSGVLKTLGYDVVASDIHDWGAGYDVIADVFYMTTPLAPVVWTNPPFSRAAELVRHLFAIGVAEVILFQSWSWPTQVGAWDLFDVHPPTHFTPLRRRVSPWRFDISIPERKGSTPDRYCWFRFQAGFNGLPAFTRIPKAEEWL